MSERPEVLWRLFLIYFSIDCWYHSGCKIWCQSNQKMHYLTFPFPFGWIFGIFQGRSRFICKISTLSLYLRREGPPVLKMRSYSIQLLNCENQREDFFHKIFKLPDEQHATVDQHQIWGKCYVMVVFLMVMVVVRRCQMCWGWHDIDSSDGWCC